MRVGALQKEQGANLSPMDCNIAKADRLAESQANLGKMVDAAKPLYATLDDARKHNFIALGRTLVPERGQFAEGDETSSLRSNSVLPMKKVRPESRRSPSHFKRDAAI